MLGLAGRGVIPGRCQLLRLGLILPCPPLCITASFRLSTLIAVPHRLLSTVKGQAKNQVQQGRGTRKHDDKDGATRIRPELSRMESGGEWRWTDKEVTSAMGKANRQPFGWKCTLDLFEAYKARSGRSICVSAPARPLDLPSRPPTHPPTRPPAHPPTRMICLSSCQPIQWIQNCGWTGARTSSCTGL